MNLKELSIGRRNYHDNPELIAVTETDEYFCIGVAKSISKLEAEQAFENYKGGKSRVGFKAGDILDSIWDGGNLKIVVTEIGNDKTFSGTVLIDKLQTYGVGHYSAEWNTGAFVKDMTKQTITVS